MRRRLLLLSGAFALLGLWGGMVFHREQQPLGGPTKASFERVRVGMTAKEVEAILGLPGRHRDFYYSDDDSGPDDRLQWVEQEAVFTVYLDNKGRVGSKQLRHIGPQPESLRDRFRRWCERVFGAS